MVLTDETSVVAFYGASTDAGAIDEFTVQTEEWLRHQRLDPDKMSITRTAGKSKMVRYEQGLKDLRKNGFGAVTDLSIFCLCSGGTVPLEDYTVMASYSRQSAYTLFASRLSEVTLGTAAFLDVAKKQMDLSSSVYGIGYQRSHMLGPVPYAIGLAQGLGFTGEEYEEALNISRWGDMGMARRVYQSGLMRDVYPMNFLSSIHLERLVQGLTLRDWIDQSQGRGVLTPFGAEHWLWDLRLAERGKVKSQLNQSGLIFSWR